MRFAQRANVIGATEKKTPFEFPRGERREAGGSRLQRGEGGAEVGGEGRLELAPVPFVRREQEGEACGVYERLLPGLVA